MDQNTVRYIESQLEAVTASSDKEQVGQLRIQITSELGKTNWLNITPAVFDKIKAVLLGESA